MSGAPVLSYAQRVAPKLSPCWGTINTSNNNTPNPRYRQVDQSQYDLVGASDDSDSLSQTSSQTSSNDDNDTTFSSPPTSVSSDGDSICEARLPTNSQSLHSTTFGTSTVSHGQIALGQDGATQFQELHNVAFRPRDIQTSREQSSQYSSQVSSCTVASQNGSQKGGTVSTSEPRRRRCSFGSTCPPKLKRDTDNTEAIVKMIVVFCTNLINSIWCPRAFDETTSSSGVLPLQIFITETLRRSKTSYSTLQIALYYLILLKQCLPCPQGTQSGQSGCRAMQCGRRMFLTALILGSKYLQDRNYSARAWSKISGLPLKEINENERRYLGMISWDLHVPKETFENWSKIVLAICRLSSDGDVPGRDLDRRPPGPGTGLAGVKQTQLQNMCGDTSASRTWWLNNLRCLSLGMVKCSRQTEDFLATVSPFRPISTLSPQFLFDALPRVYSPDNTSESDTESTTTPKCLPRLPSIDKLAQTYQALERSASPATSYKMPPQPILRNLPTPQTTPRAEASNLWAGLCKQNLRCKASASALGNLDKNLLPANLESCPPPKPRSCDRARSSTLSSWTNSFTSWQMSREPTPSLTSSPESVVSDISSIPTRSRSSSISSTSSWLPTVTNTPSQDGDHRFRHDMMNLQQKLAAQRMPSHARRTTATPARPNLSRSQTAVKMSGSEDESCFTNDRLTFPKLRHAQSMRFAGEGYGNEDLEFPDKESYRKTEAAQALLAFHSRSSTPNPTSDSSQSLERKSSPYLKRARSDSTNLVQLETKLALLDGQQTWQVSQDSWLSQFAEAEDEMKERVKQTQLPCQQWATPRKPIQCGAQNKRMAMQIPDTAPNVAAHYLRTELLV